MSNYRASTEAAIRRRMQAGKYLRGLREDLGLTQQEACERLGYGYNTFISQIELGRVRVPPEDWVKWSEVYGVKKDKFARKLLGFYDPHVATALFSE